MFDDSRSNIRRSGSTRQASWRGRYVALPALALAAALAGGCSAGSSAKETVTGWFGAKGVTAYARSEGVPVYAQPASGAKRVGHLSMSEKVERTGEKNGYVRIDARGGSLKGWVAAPRLADRRPAVAAANEPGRADAASSSDEPAPTPEQAEAGDIEASARTAEETAGPAESATPSAAGGPDRPAGAPAGGSGVGASVFDPY